ncbi:hypothetical protein AGOR_G00038160 [Albula goreensis]|uniref:BSD domain-containing protein n=1 Tax=Albula goreensis TaxID=1534307 RepID=A0A8T3DXH8_9TELE|nr:hypothetical protein AGOR_G00038160 [Albula goreensis]
MAEGDGGWWGGWLQQSFQAVKDKSAEAYEFLKRDLTEFSNVVQHDTACSIAATAIAVRDKLAVEGSSETTDRVKKSLSNILGVITDTLAPPPDKTIDCNVITLVATPAGTTEVYDSAKARLYSLQADPATYCNEPDGPPEHQQPLNSSPVYQNGPCSSNPLRILERYFYKVFQLDQEEARRVALKQRAEKSTDSEGLEWEEEEDEFMVATFTSRLDLNSHEEVHFAAADAPEPPPEALPAGLGGGTADLTVSASCENAGPTTQSERLGLEQLSPDEELTQRLTEASIEEPDPERGRATVRGSGLEEKEAELGATTKSETLRAERPHDLRFYELNSDSGKSSPSDSGKEGSSTDVSEDWEKDFDLDMTEEEVKLALSSVNTDIELDDEDWESWD